MRNLLVLTLLATLSLWAAENTLPDELLEKYYQTETIVTKDGELLDKITISGPPTPPPGFERPTVSGIELAKTDGVGMISTGELDFNQSSASRMPAYNWSFGCTATTAAMMAAWYDRIGYPNVYTGPTGGGVAPIYNNVYPDVFINGERRHQTPLSATHKGLDGRKTRGHVDDYWVKYGSTNTDPYYRHWTEHTYSSCTGDYMKTNQWYHDQKNSDGSTSIYNWTSSGKPLTAADMESLNIHTKDGPYGLKLFFESRGYSVTTLYNQNIDARFSGVFTFAQYKAEIKAGRPVLIHVKGHTMEGIGWKDPNIVYLHDTWDYNVHEMTWGGSYSGMKHQSVSVIHLADRGTNTNSKAMPAIISYLLSDSGSNNCVVGAWNKTFDWNCDGSRGFAVNTFNANGTFSSSGNIAGTWKLTGNKLTQVFSNGTVYRGTVNSGCNYMSGTMVDYRGSTGCWHSRKSRSTLTAAGMTDDYEEKLSENEVSGNSPDDAGK